MIDTIRCLINDKTPDHVRIRYYPSCLSDSQHNKILRVTDLNDVDKGQLSKYLKDKPFVSGTFTEYGIKDIFVRISTVSPAKEEKNVSERSNSRLFFKRELYIFDRIQDQTNNVDETGVYIIEY